MFANVYPILCVPGTLLSNYLTERWGLRCTLNLAFFLSCVGAWGRSLFNFSPALALASHAVLVVLQPTFNNMIPRVSVAWFRLERVVTATSFMFGMSAFGLALGQILPPALVQESPSFSKDQVTYLAIVQASLFSFAWLVALFLFRAKPGSPPSAVAETPRFDLCTSLCVLLRSGPFLLLLASQFLVSAGSVATYTLLEPMLAIFEYPSPARFASLINAASCVIGFFATLGVGVLVDRTKHFKLPLFLSSLLTAVDLGVFAWFGEERLQWLAALLIVALGILVSVTMTISVELGCEVAYPIESRAALGRRA